MRIDKDFIREAAEAAATVLDTLRETGAITASAKVLAHARDALVEQGFTREEALTIILTKENFFPKINQ